MEMKTTLVRNPHLVIKKSPIHGFGVFAEADIPADEIIEECYSLGGTQDLFGTSVFNDYYFGIDNYIILPLGFGAIYNHSQDPNAKFTFTTLEPIITFKTIKPIKKGEEIYVSYGDEWFSCRGKRILDVTEVKKRAKLKSLLWLSARFVLASVVLVAGLKMLLNFLIKFYLTE